MVEAAGRVADGLLGHPMFTREVRRRGRPPRARRGAPKRDATSRTSRSLGVLICSVDDDVDAARRRLAFAVGQYAASRVYDRLFALHGWTDAQQRIREAARARDADAVVAAVPDEAIDAIGVACRPASSPAGRAARAGYDHLALVAAAVGADARAGRSKRREVLIASHNWRGPH